MDGKRKLGKKGSMIDLFFFLGLFLVIGISFVLGAYLYNQVMTPMSSFFGENSTATSQMYTVRRTMNSLDYIFAFMFIMLNIIPVYLSIQVQNHPIFFVINIVLFIIYLILTPVISNSMLKIWSQGELSGYSAGGSEYVTFPIMTRIFQYMPVLSFGLAFILSIAMFGKGRGGEI